MNKPSSPTPPAFFSVAIIGSGGSGAVTTGQIFLRALANCGFHGLMTRSAGPQIRGGESAAMIRFGVQPVECMGDRFDLVIGLDWRNAERFAGEIPVTADSLIVCEDTQPPGFLENAGILPLAWKRLADEIPGGRLNMVALGALGALCGLPYAALEQAVQAVMAPKGRDVFSAAIACLGRGYGQDLSALPAVPAPPRERPSLWQLSGNEGCGLGALRGGVRFVAAYPITPASEMLEWMAPRLEHFGGCLLQAEDELASINMAIGASFGGVPSLTATSGPGLSLMVEGLGLAVASETPVTVVDVMRGGPSTGIPTKSEQSDLNIALHGRHGDAPLLVLAPLSVRDCVFTCQWAVQLSEHLQCPSLVLSDQSLGQARAVTDAPRETGWKTRRRTADVPGADYRRYQITADGISPMSLPGTPGGMYTADGLEHDEHGTPSSLSGDHLDQLEKRARKLREFDYGEHWAELRGEGADCLITWGSCAGASFEAAERLRARGRQVRVIALRLLAPLVREDLEQALRGAERIHVVEQNHGGQLFHYLRSLGVLPPSAVSLAHPGPLPLRPGEIVSAIGEEAP
jgi:2-oxoglutarate ferredoxin oxidoreductase subunit alpha